MKVKSLVCLAFASIVSVQAFALEIYKGHVISHKEWSTGNAKGAFVAGHMTNQSLRLTRPVASRGEGDFVSSYSHISSSSGKAGVPAIVIGDGMVYIANGSQGSKQYAYQYTVCAEIADKTEQCLYSYDEIELDADGYFQESRQPQLQLTFATPGDYHILTATMIMGEHGLSSIVNSTSDGIISIS